MMILGLEIEFYRLFMVAIINCNRWSKIMNGIFVFMVSNKEIRTNMIVECNVFVAYILKNYSIDFDENFKLFLELESS